MASRYWVGNGGNWSDTAHWAASSGGAGGQSVPTSADNVFFDANSFSMAAQSVVVDVSPASFADMTWTGATNSPTLDCSGGVDLYCYGSLTLIAGMTFTASGFQFLATSTGKTITTAGKVIVGGFNAVIFGGIGGGWTLQDAFSVGENTIRHEAGNLDFNDKNVTCGNFYLQGNTTRVLSLGTGTLTLSNASSNNFFAITGTNYTFNCETSQINITNDYPRFDGGGNTFYNVTFTATHKYAYIFGANTFHDLTFAVKAATSTAFVYLQSGVTQTVTGTFTASGFTLSTGRLTFKSCSTDQYSLSALGYDYGATGVAATISAATVSIQWTDFMDITGSGAGTWSGTSIGNAGGNSGITFTAAVTRYWIGHTGNWHTAANWSATSGGAGGASVPLCHDSAVFDANSFNAGSQSVSAPDTTLFAAMDWTNAANTPAFNAAGVFCGQVKFIAAMTLPANNSDTVLACRSNNTFTTAGLTVASSFASFVFDEPGATLTLSGNLVMTDNVQFHILRGTFDANGNNVTGYVLNAPQTATTNKTRHVKLGTGTWTFSGYGIKFSNSSSDADLTITPSTSAIVSTGSTTFSGGSKTYYDLTFQGSTNYIYGGNGYHNLTAGTYAGLRKLAVPATKTQTISGTFTVSGNNSTTQRFQLVAYEDLSGRGLNGVVGTISAAAVSLTDVDFYDITGSGAATWSGTRLANGGGNSNITFLAATTRYWVGGAGAWSDAANHWAATSGGAAGAANFPLCQDNVVFNASSFSVDGDTINVDGFYAVTDFTWTGATHTPVFDMTNASGDFTGFVILGNTTFIAAMSVTDGGNGYALRFSGRGATTLTLNGLDPNSDVWFVMGATAGSLTFQDAPTFDAGNAHYIKHLSGTLNTNNLTFTTSRYWSADYNDDEYDFTYTRTLNLGTGTLHLTGDDSWDYVLNLTDGNSWLTFNDSTSKILIDANTANLKSVYLDGGHGETYTINKIEFDDTGGGGLFIYAHVPGPTISWFKNLVAPATITLGYTGNSPTNGITVDRWDVNGAAGSLVVLTASLDATGTSELKKTGIGQHVSDYLNVSYIGVTAGTFLAGKHSTDSGNNSNVEFVNPIKQVLT